jgi:DNA phosphorothioation-associated putative methyltransferase
MPAKIVAQRSYVHVAYSSGLDDDARQKIAIAERCANVLRGAQFNVMRFDPGDTSISLLNYADFFDDAFPVLRESWRVDLGTGRVTYRTYTGSLNPPILHRKELLLADDHPRHQEYVALTQVVEGLGLFDEPTRIGFRAQWDQLIRDRGYQVVGHEILPIGNDEAEQENYSVVGFAGHVARHLTALVRYGFSAPIQSLARYGFLNGTLSVFDYGCGRGDDLRGLQENGITATGWDPYFAPTNVITTADVVNLGFVINVIEDAVERAEALKRAYGLAQCVLAVSAMLLSNRALIGRQHRDGVLTQRNTFQKYYTQRQLHDFILDHLEEEPIAIGPGVFFVFKDKSAEQRFLTSRIRDRSNALRLKARPDPIGGRRTRRADVAAQNYALHRALLDSLWDRWLNLGREPEPDEIEQLPAIHQAFGSLRRTLRLVLSQKHANLLDAARDARTEDLRVYFALGEFGKRRPYRHLDIGLQRDVKAFFGSHKNAQSAGRQALLEIGGATAIEGACQEASERGLGWLEPGRSLTVHSSMVPRLPVALRVYAGCSSALYGDIESADLVKIHVRSGKLTLMKFDDFEGQPLPRMIQRTKLDLRTQDVEVFDYGDIYEPPFLYLKSRFINEEFPRYAEQSAFDDTLVGLELFGLSGYGPSPTELLKALETHRWIIEGFELVRMRTIPNLDASCGRYLTFRDLIECGETQARTRIANLPRLAESYNALYDLAVKVLDPLIDYFGMIKLTYGFCSLDLAQKIDERVAPNLDQHAAHEVNRKGHPVCDRLGAAIDFSVEDEDMRGVAEWAINNVPFDRLYFYGRDKPIHISFGPEASRAVYSIVPAASGRSMPRRGLP